MFLIGGMPTLRVIGCMHMQVDWSSEMAFLLGCRYVGCYPKIYMSCGTGAIVGIVGANCFDLGIFHVVEQWLE